MSQVAGLIKDVVALRARQLKDWVFRDHSFVRVLVVEPPLDLYEPHPDLAGMTPACAAVIMTKVIEFTDDWDGTTKDALVFAYDLRNTLDADQLIVSWAAK